MNDDVIFKANFTSDSVEFNPNFASNNIVFPADFGTYIDGSAKNYNKLTNKPQINGVTLEGNKTSEALGIDVVTYTLTQDPVDGHKIALEGSDGYKSIITIPDNGEENRIDSVSINGIPVEPDAQKNVDITVPTKTSELENDGDGTNDFATVNQIPTIPTNVSAFNNDAGYITSDDVSVKGIERNGIEQVPDENGIVDISVPTDTSDLTNNAGFIVAVELTQTQYDMLSPEEKMNGSMYLVRPDDN